MKLRRGVTAPPLYTVSPGDVTRIGAGGFERRTAASGAGKTYASGAKYLTGTNLDDEAPRLSGRNVNSLTSFTVTSFAVSSVISSWLSFPASIVFQSPSIST